MIIKARTYQLKAASVAEVQKRSGEAPPGREKYSRLAAFWLSEMGRLLRFMSTDRSGLRTGRRYGFVRASG